MAISEISNLAAQTEHDAGSPAMPPGFIFGVSTAAYQIEGAVHEDGRGTSIWDTFSHTPGNVVGDDNGDVACDHYHRYAEDVRLIKALGADVYRFSVAWPRVQPTGSGPVNSRGLDFYSRLVDELLDAGITPWLTLYHWDLPQPLEDAGGWRVRDTAERFAEYAQVVYAALGDRVPWWATLNEPFCSSIVGYAEGRHAPGVQEGEGALAAAHHLLLGHGLTVRALRAAGVDGTHRRLGISLNLTPAVPVSSSAEDAAAVRRADTMSNRLFTDPVLAGRYPQAAREMYADLTDFGFIHDGDLAITSEPLDFLGVNYYFREHVADAPVTQADPARRSAYDIGVRKLRPEGVELTDSNWPIEPVGLSDLMLDLHRSFPDMPPIYITENGRSSVDEVGDDGTIDDADRISYVRRHLAALATAIEAGVDIRGYIWWSLLDNFEWAEGYAKRFGLVHVDYPTGTRTPKRSFRWYRDLIVDHHSDDRS